MFHDADLHPDLLGLLAHPVAIDALDLLGEHAQTFDTLRAQLRVKRSELDTALRVLATHGFIERIDHRGTWDQRTPHPARYAPTATGLALAHQLRNPDVLDQIYAYYLQLV